MRMKWAAMLLVFSLAILTLLGCKRDPIAEKLARNQALSAEEKATYTKDADSKKRYDEWAQERKEHIAWEHYRQPTEAEVKSGSRVYKSYDWKDHTLNITSAATEALGFLPGTKVKIPDKGEAYIVGVDKDGDLWFHLDGTEGGEWWRGWKKDDFSKNSITIVTIPKSGEQSAPKAVAAIANVADAKHAVVADTKESVELHVDELEKLPPIPPVPPFKEKK